jgi:hypothetical protein
METFDALWAGHITLGSSVLYSCLAYSINLDERTISLGFASNRDKCYFLQDDMVYQTEQFKLIKTHHKIGWISFKSGGTVPGKAIVAVVDKNGKSQYVCRATSSGNVVPGFTYGDDCFYSRNDQAQQSGDYQMMVWKD